MGFQRVSRGITEHGVLKGIKWCQEGFQRVFKGVQGVFNWFSRGFQEGYQRVSRGTTRRTKGCQGVSRGIQGYPGVQRGFKGYQGVSQGVKGYHFFDDST